MRSALLLALLASGAVGCVDNDASLSILQMEAVTNSNNCMATATVGVERARGIYDISFMPITGYFGVPLIRNNLQTRKPSSDSPELNSIQLIGFNVTLNFADPTAAKNVPASALKYFWPAAGGRIDPAGLAAVYAELIPPNVANKLSPAVGSPVTVTAEIRPVGMQTSDRLIGGPIFFPIDVCNQCLQDPEMATCPLPMGTPISDVGCIRPQDDVPTCCTCSSTSTSDSCPANKVVCGAAAPVVSSSSVVFSSPD